MTKEREFELAPNGVRVMSQDPRRGWLVNGLKQEISRLTLAEVHVYARGVRLGEPYATYCRTLAACHEAARRVYETELASLIEERLAATAGKR